LALLVQVIVYTPLIPDWSGSKVLKSLFLQETAYDYLKKENQEYLLSYKVLRCEKRDLTNLWQEVEKWVDEPCQLLHGYSLHYLHLFFERRELVLGVVPKQTLEPHAE
jgi:hypothetical protein